MKKLLFLSAFYFASFINAQYNPQMFAKLYTGGEQEDRGIVSLKVSAQFGDQLFFISLDSPYDVKLYVTDGTVANTKVLKTDRIDYKLGVFNNEVYFRIASPANGAELWKTDGTLAGTKLIKILGGTIFSPAIYKVIGNRLFFASCNSATTRKQMYVLEAGSETPQLLTPGLFDVKEMIDYQGKLFFSASDSEVDSQTRIELYTSDGTVAGTQLVKDIYPGTNGSFPQQFAIFQNKLFFGANNGINGRELWTSDGTAEGTQLFKDINPGSASSVNTLYLNIYNGKLYFPADDGVHSSEIWVTDGTLEGTKLIKDINPTEESRINDIVIVNGKIVMIAFDGTHGKEPWMSDGTTENTKLLMDIKLNSGDSSNQVLQSNVFCSHLFFDADNGTSGKQPWVTDGTSEGTHLIKILEPSGTKVDGTTGYVLFKNKIYFSAKTPAGSQLYVMDSNCANMGVANTNVADFKIFPTPAKDFINIESKIPIEKVDIYNAAGQLVLNSAGNKKQIDIRKLSSGVYLMKLTDSNKNTSSKKIIIK